MKADELADVGVGIQLIQDEEHDIKNPMWNDDLLKSWEEWQNISKYKNKRYHEINRTISKKT